VEGSQAEPSQTQSPSADNAPAASPGVDGVGLLIVPDFDRVSEDLEPGLFLFYSSS
jgi:hypothetical protein